MLSKHELDSGTAPRVSAIAAAAIIARRAFLALAALRLSTASRLEDELAVDDSELELELDGDGLGSFSFIAALSRRSPSKSIHSGVPGDSLVVSCTTPLHSCSGANDAGTCSASCSPLLSCSGADDTVVVLCMNS